MARQDFYGRWTVNDTTGTPFGLGTTIEIGASVGGGLEVAFDPAAGVPQATYDEGLDTLMIFGLQNTRILFVSRYVDLRYDFKGIYGLALMGSALRTALFMASGEGSRDVASTEASTISGSDFATTFKVRTTCGAQFGKASTVTIEETDQDTCTLAITNASGENVNTPDAMVFDPSVCALTGALNNEDTPEVRFQISLAILGSRKYAYGLSVIGDPVEAGAWGGGEEEAEPPPEPLEPPKSKGKKS